MSFLCPKCGKPFDSKIEVGQHTSKKHPDIPLPFSSEFMDSITEVEEEEQTAPKTKKSLKKHEGKEEKAIEEDTGDQEKQSEEEGETEEKSKCPDCGKVFIGKPPAKCPKCGAEFV